MPKNAKSFIDEIRDESGIDDGCPLCGGYLEGAECVDCGTNFSDRSDW